MSEQSIAKRLAPRALGTRFVEWMTGGEHATISMSLLRILYGGAIAWFLIVSAADRHYLWGAGSRWVDPIVDLRHWPAVFTVLFSKDDPALFDLAYGALIALAFLFTVGFATRIVTPLLLLFWVGLSSNSVFLTNGGDLVIRITLLFLVFANLSRHWSVDAWLHVRGVGPWRSGLRRWIPEWALAAAHNTALVLCAYQIMLVYVTSGIFKLQGTEWLEGSALYYALNLEVFRVFPTLSDLMWQVTPFVLVGSWASIWAQLLFPVLMLWRPTRYAALAVILSMHLGIGLFLGLWPFSIAMIALDLLFVRDASWQRAFAASRAFAGSVRDAFAERRRPAPSSPASKVNV